MSVRTLTKFVKRYTTLSSALDTLKNRHLILLHPSKWDDTNDSYFMQLYQEEAQVGSLLALCCTMATETYHHWKVFTAGIEGVCIEIDRLQLELGLGQLPYVKAGPVQYLKIKELEALTKDQAGQLPFVKREAFGDEREWRIIARCDQKMVQTLPVPLDIAAISRVVFNPWMPRSLVANLRDIIRKLPGCDHLKIERSLLTNSTRWKEAGKKLCL